MRLKRETQGAFGVLNANSQTRKSMKIHVICTVLTEIDHKGPNWTVLILKMTFRVSPYPSYFRT